MHAIGYYLNPQYHFQPNFKVCGIAGKNIFHCVARLVSGAVVRAKMKGQFVDFNFCNGPLFDIEYAREAKGDYAPSTIVGDV